MSVYGPSGRLSFRRTRVTLGRPTGCTTVHYRYRAATILTNVFASIPPLARSVLTRRYGPSAVPGPGQLLAVRCPRTGQTSDYRWATLLLWVLSGPVFKHRPRSLTCARVFGMHKPKGEMKVKVGLRAVRGRMGRVTMGPRTTGASRSHCEKRRT